MFWYIEETEGEKDERSTYSSEPKTIKDIDDNIVIIAAEPGMGKSTILTYLAMETKKDYPSLLWIVKVNLVDYSTELNRLKEGKIKFDKMEAIKFLYRTVGFQIFKIRKEEERKKKEKLIDSFLNSITIKDDKISLEALEEEDKDLNLLEIELFNNYYNRGKIALLFDGFDEVSPDYKNEVIKLLQTLQGTKVEKLWITTRPYNIQSELEDKLNAFSYDLEPFSVKDQAHFLKNFWKKYLDLEKLDDRKCKVFALRLIKTYTEMDDNRGRVVVIDKIKRCRDPASNLKKEFMSIPLHIHILAEIFESEFKEFYYSEYRNLFTEYPLQLSEELNLVELYERIIKIKFDKIRFGEKKPSMHTDDPDFKRLIEKEREECIRNHKKLAVHAIFPEDKLGELLSEEEIGEVRKLIDIIKLGEEKTGVITQIVDNKARFVHRTFAEYFAVELIYDKLKSSSSTGSILNFLINTIFIENYQNIRRFFDSKLEMDQEFEDLCSHNNHFETIFKLLLTQNCGTPVNYIESALHVTEDEILLNIINFLLKSVEYSLNKSEINDFVEIINFIEVNHIEYDLIDVINTGEFLRFVIAYGGNEETLEKLLKLVAKVDAERLIEVINVGEHEFHIPLFLAIQLRVKEKIELIFKYVENEIVDIMKYCDKHYGKTILHKLAENSRFDMVFERIYKLDAEQRMEVLSVTDYHCRMPTHYAAIENDFNFFHLLYDLLDQHQFNHVCTTQDDDGYTPLDLFHISRADCDKMTYTAFEFEKLKLRVNEINSNEHVCESCSDKHFRGHTSMDPSDISNDDYDETRP